MANRSVIASLLGLAVLAGACSAPSEEVSERADVQVTSTTTPAELAFVDEADSDASLHLALTRPDSWMPAELSLTDQNAVIMADLLYDGLTETSGATLRAGLAITWEANSSSTQWTFSLDPARTTGAAVVASFEQLRVEAPNSAAVSLLSEVESIISPDEETVVFDLASPNAALPWLLSGVQYSVVETGELSGRYEVVVDTAEQMELTSAVYPDVTVAWADDGKLAYHALTLAQVDAAVVDPAESRDAATRFGQEPSARSVVRFYGLNLLSEDLRDIRVREAAMISIDRPAVFDELETAAFTADGAAGASTAGFRYGACDRGCIYNPQRARSLLADAGEQPTLTVVYVGDDQAGVAAEISSSLRRGGFGTEVVQVTAAELPAMIVDGTAEVFSYGWAAPAASMDAVVPPLFHSNSPLNAMHFGSTEVDELIAAAMSTTDDNTRWDLLAEAHELALNNFVLIPVAIAHNGLVTRPDLAPLAVRADGSIDATTIE